MLKVLICGTREREPWQKLKKIVSMLDPDDVVVAGGARGVDRCAVAMARARGLKTCEYPADWNLHGRAAGPIRNQQMLDSERPDLVIALHNDPGLGKGTRDMVQRAMKAGVVVVVLAC